jgi:hypothetical protein
MFNIGGIGKRFKDNNSRACGSSTVVDKLPHHPKVKGSSPAPKMGEKMMRRYKVSEV